MEEEKTIEYILNEMKERVKNNTYVSPVSWIESAMRLNILSMDLDNELAILEGKMSKKESEYIKEDIPANKAKVLSKQSIDYIEYLKLKAKLKRIDEYIKIAKKRSTIQDI